MWQVFLYVVSKMVQEPVWVRGISASRPPRAVPAVTRSAFSAAVAVSITARDTGLNETISLCCLDLHLLSEWEYDESSVGLHHFLPHCSLLPLTPHLSFFLQFCLSLPPLIWFCISLEMPSYSSYLLSHLPPFLHRFSFMSHPSSCLSQCTTFPSYVTSLSLAPVTCICSSFPPQRPLIFIFLSYHLHTSVLPYSNPVSSTDLGQCSGQQPLLSSQASLWEPTLWSILILGRKLLPCGT